ncbi:DUF1987 domain-containing protein [Sulfuricurvum sp.]|uniref:DUF1987 domain-containing protein n=1 Tax=Sulfuricurvum sp. TaxID=2025608 RepID=UPI002E348F2D|nr:DUF1987 domain-containing protein [Sulfuricurvum sp.]HEX5330506.1 DUF1987 domain-containing protein [Sulfuricurvum sp.]
MENIIREATERTPAVIFDFENGVFSFKGESYPEDASAFFGPLHKALDEFLNGAFEGEIVFNVEFEYFNSSSAKVLMNLFQLLEDAAETKGKNTVINWYYNEDDDTMQEFGEDFASDMEHAAFNLCVLG